MRLLRTHLHAQAGVSVARSSTNSRTQQNGVTGSSETLQNQRPKKAATHAQTHVAIPTQFLPVMATMAAPFISKMDCTMTSTHERRASAAENTRKSSHHGLGTSGPVFRRKRGQQFSGVYWGERPASILGRMEDLVAPAAVAPPTGGAQQQRIQTSQNFVLALRDAIAEQVLVLPPSFSVVAASQFLLWSSCELGV